jgi:hypothetical protein
MNIPTRRKNAACLSDYELDALLVGEATGEKAAHIQDHLRECKACETRHQKLEAFAREFAARKPIVFREPLKEKPARKRASVAWGGMATIVSLAAGAIFFVRTTAHESGSGSDGVRLKGTSSVGYFVEHAGRIRRAGQAETVEPGDKLQFVYSTKAPAHVIVLSLDGAMAATVYYSSNRAMAATTMNGEEPVPTSVTLDGVLGDETVLGLVCASPQPSEVLRNRLESDASKLFVAPDGCDVTRWSLKKVAKAP